MKSSMSSPLTMEVDDTYIPGPEISQQSSEDAQEIFPQTSKASWENYAYEEQQIWLGKLGDRASDYLEYSKLKPLQMKVGFALYSHPTQCTNTNLYENGKNQCVIKICDKIHELCHEIYSDGIYFSVLYIYCYIEPSTILFKKKEAQMFQNVLFKIRKGRYSEEEYFIDSNLRVYNSWDDFKKYNTYPKCWYALPKDGRYQSDPNGRVLLDIEKSPACSLKSKLLNVVDIGGLVLGVGGVVGSFVFPPASPLLIGSLVASGASGVFTGGRAIGKLTDRQKHKQSLKDKEAVFLWIELTLSAVTVGTSSFSIFKSVRAARAIGTANEAVAATSAGEQVASVASETVTTASSTIDGGQVALKSTSKAASKLKNLAGKSTKTLGTTTNKGVKLARGSRHASKFGSAVGKGNGAKTVKNAAKAVKAIKNTEKTMKFAKKGVKAAKAVKRVADVIEEVAETATSLPNTMSTVASTVTAVEESTLIANFRQLLSGLGTQSLGLIQSPVSGVAATAAFTSVTTFALKILLQISIDYINSSLTMKHKELLQEILTLITKIQSGTLEPLHITQFISFINFYFNTLVINHEHFIDNFIWNVYQTASKWLNRDIPAELPEVLEINELANESAHQEAHDQEQLAENQANVVIWNSTLSSNGNEIITNLISDLECAQIDWSAIDFSEI